MKYVIGIDIGGTNTDCVLVDFDGAILRKIKMATTKQLEDAVADAIKALCISIKSQDILRVCLGTTFATNAILEQKRLLSVGVIRIAGHRPAVPPGYIWPQMLRDAVIKDAITIDGGYQCDGSPLNPFLEQKAMDAIDRLVCQGIQAIAVTGVYSPLNDDQEKKVMELALQQYPNMHISCSSEIGGLGFFQRESATILNASLKQAMKEGFYAIAMQVRQLGIDAPLYMVKNDGSVMAMEEAIKNPIFTIAAGQTNSFFGAAALAQVADAVVVDIGGTSTDIGLVANGIPKRSCHEAAIGPVRLQFPMPDAISLAIGGGTIVRISGDTYSIGPDSVGSALMQEAISFGGSTLTLTDIAMRCGKMHIPEGRPELVAIDLSLAQRIMHEVEQTIMDSVVLMQGKNKNCDVIICGGGALLGFQDGMVLPQDAGFANAYGAARAGVSATIDTTMSLQDRQQVLEKLKADAIKKAVDKGADPSSVLISHMEISPYAYSKESLARVIISASGRYAV